MYKLDSKTRFKDMVKINQSIPNIMTLVCPFDRYVEASEGRLRSVFRPICTLSANLTTCDWAVTVE